MFSRYEYPKKISDGITRFYGSWTFVTIFSASLCGWVLLNSVYILWGKFDPYPYIILNLILSIMNIFQSSFIMMSQNRQIERDSEMIRGLHVKLDKLTQKKIVLTEKQDGI